MTRVLKTPEGKKIVIDVNNDDCIYTDPTNNNTRGTDLHAHEAKSGKTFFYFYRWSQWENESTRTELCDIRDAEAFLIQRSGEGLVTENEIETAKQYGIDLLEETA